MADLRITIKDENDEITGFVSIYCDGSDSEITHNVISSVLKKYDCTESSGSYQKCDQCRIVLSEDSYAKSDASYCADCASDIF